MNGATLRVTGVPKVNKDGLLVVVVEAEQDGQPMQLDNPFLFMNPPLRVPDGGTWVDDNGNTLKSYVEDAAEAARTIIAQAVGVA